MANKRAGYNRKQLRQRYGKSLNTISNWCIRKSYHSVPELNDLVELLDCKVDDLYVRSKENGD
nr:helix-turn-helix domain-containing protein [Heyndrickxia oleronia]